MRYRTNPWPSFSDLFSATLIVTFAGIVMITAAYKSDVQTLKNQITNMQGGDADMVAAKVRQARLDANKIIEQVKQELNRDTSLKTTTHDCGDNTCLDIDIEFERNDALIKNPEDLSILKSVALSLKKAIDALPLEQRKDIEIVIEGHTDKTLPKNVLLDDRGLYLYNWDLSARRATSVAYEFKQSGLTPDGYRIVAIGYAASDPICTDDNMPDCEKRNRRTTLYLRGDTRGIEKRSALQRAADSANR